MHARLPRERRDPAGLALGGPRKARAITATFPPRPRHGKEGLRRARISGRVPARRIRTVPLRAPAGKTVRARRWEAILSSRAHAPTTVYSNQLVFYALLRETAIPLDDRIFSLFFAFFEKIKSHF